MFADGTLTAGLVEHGAVWLWLHDGQSWEARGTAVRSALSATLEDPGGWGIDPAPGEVLHRVTTDLLGDRSATSSAHTAGRCPRNATTTPSRSNWAEPASTARPLSTRCA